MYALVWHNYDDQTLRAVSVSEDLDTLRQAAFDIEIELNSDGAEDDEDAPDWDVSDWQESEPRFPGEPTVWAWAPEWFEAGCGYQINLVAVE